MPLVVARVTPHGIGFLGIQLEIPFRELERRGAGQSQIRPTLNEFNYRFEGVQRQAIVTVVRHVRHKNIDRIVNDGLEQFSTLYRFVQFFPPAWISVDEDRVREKAARLPR